MNGGRRASGHIPRPKDKAFSRMSRKKTSSEYKIAVHCRPGDEDDPHDFLRPSSADQAPWEQVLDTTNPVFSITSLTGAIITGNPAPDSERTCVQMCFDTPPDDGDHEAGATMTIEELAHVNLRTANLDRLKDFYTEALGFQSAETGGAKRGWWLGSQGKVMLHLIEAERTDRPEHPQIEHFAFRARGLRHMMRRLNGMGKAYNLNPVPAESLVQLNLRDPDDNRLHLDFSIDEHEPGMAPAELSLR